MAIAFDTSSSGTSASASLTYAHTCTGSDLVLFVVVRTDNSASAVSATYAGVSMTYYGSYVSAVNGTTGRMYTFYLNAPATGANNVIVTATGSAYTYAASVSYTGVGGLKENNSQNDVSLGIGQSLTTSVTTTVDLCRVVYFVHGGAVPSAGTGATLRVSPVSGNFTLFDNGSNKTPAGSVSETAGNIATTHACGQMIALVPVVSSLYWVGGTGTWDASSTTHWSDSSGGSGGYFPPSTQSVLFDASSGGGTVTVSAGTSGDLTTTGYTGTIAGSGALSISGSLTLSSGITLTYTGAITFTSTSTGKTITTASKTIGGTITFNGVGGGWTFQDALTSTSSITLTNGAVVLNNLSHSIASFASSNSNTRSISLGNGTLTLTSTGTVWNCATSANMTVTPSTSTIKINDTSSSSKTFSGGTGLTYGNLYLTGAGTGTFIIAGSSTFIDFKCDTPPHTIQFTALTTQTLQTFTVNGTAGNLMTLQSTVNGSPWTLYKSTSGNVVCDYLSLRDSHVSSNV